MELCPPLLLTPTPTSATCLPLVVALSAGQLSILGPGHSISLTLPLRPPPSHSNPDLRRSDPGWERSDSVLPASHGHLPQAGSLERNRVGGKWPSLGQPLVHSGSFGLPGGRVGA